MNRSIEPAFPGRSEETDMWIDGTERRTANDIQEGASGSAWPGMTIREYFAAKAMAAMIGSRDYSRNGPHESVVDHEKRLAHHAVRFADAIIAELNE